MQITLRRTAITGFLLSVLLFAQTSTAQVGFGFWDNVDLNFGFSFGNVHSDYERAVAGEVDYVGLPFPFESAGFEFQMSKPLEVGNSLDYAVRLNFGISYQTWRSPAANNYAAFLSTAQQVAYTPASINNYKVGPNVAISLDYFLTKDTSVEPYIGFQFAFHNPTATALVIPGPGGTSRIPTENELNAAGIFKPYKLIDIPLSRTTAEANEGGSMLPLAFGGLKFSTSLRGKLRYFIKYDISYFLNDYFDNTSLGVVNGDADNDMMSNVTFGIRVPINEEASDAIQTERKITKIDRSKVAKIERIQNIANLVTTDDDLRELQRIMSDKILLYDTPGVRFNELASKTVERRVTLGGSDLEAEMVEVPGGSYIIGLTSVDELNIQVQGRKRITINPFMVDKYEVDNKQYRTFLVAVGALRKPDVVDPADTSLINFNYGPRVTMEDLRRRAGFEDLTNYVSPPTLLRPEDLLPDSTKWTEMGLNEVVPWSIYFYDSFYDDRPVVCVNWYQAKMFAAWAGKRLLTESEWEYAARSGVSGRVFPWDGLDVQTKTGKYRANFKQARGVYDADGYPIMAPTDSYLPNDFGLYNVSGNISEWVLDSWNPSYVVLQNVGTANFVSPSYTNVREPRRIHRGGSWQSTEFYIGVGVRNFQDAAVGSPYIGFRCAKSVTRRYR